MKITRTINGDDIFVFDLEHIDAMHETEMYKVVQLYIDSEPRMIFGRAGDLHAEILEAYLSALDIPFEKVELVKTSHPGPMPIGDEYRVVGAGKAELKGTTLRLMDESLGYQMGPSKKQAEDCKQFIPARLELIVEAIEETEKQILEFKLRFLHSCLVPAGFVDADKYFEQLKVTAKTNPYEIGKIARLQEPYSELKTLGRTKDPFNDAYIAKLTQIRDILLE